MRCCVCSVCGTQRGVTRSPGHAPSSAVLFKNPWRKGRGSTSLLLRRRTRRWRGTRALTRGLRRRIRRRRITAAIVHSPNQAANDQQGNHSYDRKNAGGHAIPPDRRSWCQVWVISSVRVVHCHDKSPLVCLGQRPRRRPRSAELPQDTSRFRTAKAPKQENSRASAEDTQGNSRMSAA